MTDREPRVGELWSLRDMHQRELRAVVAEVAPTSITVVSFTGQRHKSNPTQFALNWTFVRREPRTALSCERMGCGRPAVFRFQRNALSEHVCPRHLPIATQAEMLEDGPQTPDALASLCPRCGRGNVTENLSLPRSRGAYWCLWECLDCMLNWISVVLNPQDRSWQIPTVVRALQGTGLVEFDEALGSVDIQSSIPETMKFRRVEGDPEIAFLLLKRPVRLKSTMPVQKLGALPSAEVNEPRRHLLPSTRNPSPSTPLVSNVELVVGEEWCDGEEGPTCSVEDVNVPDGIVTVRFPTGESQRVSLVWFQNGRWRRVVRRTVYDRLLQSKGEE